MSTYTGTIRWLGIATLATAMCGCSGARSKAEAAERQYHMIERSGGSKQELCEAARKVAEAWLRAEDETKYKFAALERDIDCNTAAMERLSQ